MRLPAIAAAVVVLASAAGCGAEKDAPRAATRASGLEAYHLETSWKAEVPTTERPSSAAGRVVRCGPPTEICPGVHAIPHRTYYYVLHGDPELEAEHFEPASARVAFSPPAGGPVVLVSLTEEGRRRLRAVTLRMARTGQKERRLQHLAFVAGDRLASFPTIDYQVTPDGIDSKLIEITGIGGAAEAEKLAKELRGA